MNSLFTTLASLLIILGIQQDKVYHFVAGALACTAVSVYEPKYCIGASIGVGLLKELWDIPRSGFDYDDWNATAFGGLVTYNF